jgi:hypothetical protein
MSGLAQILLNPRAAAERIRRTPSWAGAAAFLILAHMVTMVLLRPEIVAVTLRHLPPSATQHDWVTLLSFFHQRLGADLAFRPVRLLSGWAWGAMLLFFFNMLWTPNDPVRFRQVFSLEVHAASIDLVARIASAVSFLLSGETAQLLRVPLGLDGMLQPEGSGLSAMALNALNPFALWYVAVIALGLSRIGGLRPVSGWVTSLLAWGLNSALNLAAIALVGDRLHLRL